MLGEQPKVSLGQLLQHMVQRGGSDLHITSSTPPQIRIDGALVPLNMPALTGVHTKYLCYEVMNEEQKIRFEQASELDFSFGVKSLSRFRANVFVQRGDVAGVFRTIPYQIRPVEQLGLPPAVAKFADLPRGLVLVTGPTGSGKSTTLASIIDSVNSRHAHHIITIEDPIEFIHRGKKSVVNQREIGADTKSFKDALRYVLRQDPDVVLVGELRDLETIEAAMTVSETGHLVFATLHTNSAVQSINRVIDVFPPHQQSQIRAQLSFVLQGVVSQMLIPHQSGQGRVLASEVMIPNPAIRNLIREDKVHQVYGIMQTGQGDSGMQTMNQTLQRLVQEGQITPQMAVNRSPEPKELAGLLERALARAPNKRGR